MIDKSAIDPNALQFYRILKEAGYSAYFVGGSVRDLLLGKEPKDFDIATNATPHQIKRVIPQGRIIGRRFRHVMLEKNGGRYEIVTFRGPVVQNDALEAGEAQEELDDIAIEDHPEALEAAPAREGRDRGPRNYPDLNQFGNAEQDAIRRDFTINALFYDPDADELVDYVEGKLDIDRRLVRTIGDPQVRMEEDPIRILRAIRHKMKLGLEYDASLEAAMRAKAPLLMETSKDRIREEFLKVCNDHSLCTFLGEGKRMGLVPFIMPWFEGLAEETWKGAYKLWEKFKDETVPERHSADMGLALMMVPLVEPLVLEPYRETLKEGEKNYLPDMKYFLSCEPLRNFYLRNLRISRAQTDHLVRALFYFSRMSGLWLEQGPPRRIIGRLFQHPPAVLAARMAKIHLEISSLEVPDWLKELAAFEQPAKRREERPEREGRERGPRGRGRGRDRDREGEVSPEEQEFSESGTHQDARSDNAEPEEKEEVSPIERAPREPRTQRLPPPDAPMIWNGPLHAPVLRPVFNEEVAIRWARKNQTVRAFRPSGIPNQATDHSLQKTNLVYNYKPEIEGGGGGREENESNGSRERGRGRERTRGGRERGRGRDRNERPAAEGGRESRERSGSRDRPERNNDRPQRNQNEGPRPQANEENIGNTVNDRPTPRADRPVFDEDSIGNVLRPGEAPAHMRGLNDAGFPMEDDGDDMDDNIGNRLDAPPTSGHVGVNGEGILGRQRNGQGSGGRNNSQRRPSGGGGGSGQGGGNNQQRRGRRRGRRGGGGAPVGTGPRGPSRGNNDLP